MPTWQQHRGRLAAARRHHPDADHSELERDLRVSRVEAQLRRLVNTTPPPTIEQRARLARLALTGGDAT